MKITKISKLKLIDSFLQINFIKGFKYIDKVGEILNLYQTDEGKITYDMSPDRVVIVEPSPKITQLRVSNSDFWIHSNNSNNLGEVERFYYEEANKILNILEISRVSRVGWRNYYVYDLVKQNENLNKIFSVNNFALQELLFTGKGPSEININLHSKLLKKAESGKIAILFDIDVYSKTDLQKEKSLAFYSELKKVIEGDDLLKAVNHIINVVDK